MSLFQIVRFKGTPFLAVFNVVVVRRIGYETQNQKVLLLLLSRLKARLMRLKVLFSLARFVIRVFPRGKSRAPSRRSDHT